MEKFFVLIAEDDADDRFLLQNAFDEMGYGKSLQFVENGVELIDFLERNVNKYGNFPAFILLDLNMPKKDGREVLKEIKQHDIFKTIPVVVFSTTKNESEVKRCYELGANTYVVKPVSYDALLKFVENIRSYWFDVATVPFN